MNNLVTNSDWLPFDQYITDALLETNSRARLVEMLVECVIFWSVHYGTEGSSTRKSVAASLEAVRVIVSLGIDYHSEELASRHSSIRDYFKAPFARLKELGVPAKEIPNSIKIHGVFNKNKDIKNNKYVAELHEIACAWIALQKGEINHIDRRTYALLRGKYESSIAEKLKDNELDALIQKLSKICCLDSSEDFSLLREEFIRTLFAIKLNNQAIKRPSKLRKSLPYENVLEKNERYFEALTKKELLIILKNANLSPERKSKINSDFFQLIKKLNVSERAMIALDFKLGKSWTETIGDWATSSSEKSANENSSAQDEKKNDHNDSRSESRMLELLSSKFIVSDKFFADQNFKNGTNLSVAEYDDLTTSINNIFPNSREEFMLGELKKYSGLDKTLSPLLEKAVKNGLIISRKEGSKKLYRLV
jgi:hypothetical protein